MNGLRIFLGALVIALVSGLGLLDAFVIPRIPTYIVIGILALLAQWEIYRMFQRAGRQMHAGIGLFLGAVFVLRSTGYFVFLMTHSVIFLSIAVLLVFLIELVQPKKDLDRILNTLFPLLFVIFPLTLLIGIRNWGMAEEGLQSLLFLIAVSKIGDIFAYFAGSIFGRHKMAPTISPNKTWEGSIVGGIAAVFLAYFLATRGWAAGLSPVQALVAGLVINIATQIGDLSESLIKRSCGVKDSATYFSVMGGALDMIDSFIFAAPAYVAFRLAWI